MDLSWGAVSDQPNHNIGEIKIERLFLKTKQKNNLQV